MEKSMKVKDAVAFIRAGTQGRFFSVEFIKRTTGELRLMGCKFGSKRNNGGERAYDPEEHGLIWVLDTAKDNWRSISIAGLVRIKINGEWFKIDHSKEEAEVATT